MNSASLPEFLDRLSEVSLNFTDRVVESPANINATVNILENIALLSFPIEQEPMKVCELVCTHVLNNLRYISHDLILYFLSFPLRMSWLLLASSPQMMHRKVGKL